MGSILVSPAFNPEIVIGNSNQYRNAGEETTIVGNPEKLARLRASVDASGYALTEAQKIARQNLVNALIFLDEMREDKRRLTNLISNIQSLCSQKPSKWRQQVLDLVGNQRWTARPERVVGAILSGGWVGIIREIGKIKETKKQCENASGNGEYIKQLNKMTTVYIPEAEGLVTEAEKDVKDADNAENERRQQEAANRLAMELARTAPERERLKLENDRIQKQREADLKELKEKNAAELAAKKDRNRTILVSSVAISAILIGGYFLTRK